MTYSYTSLILQRIAIPIILVLCALYRPVGISFVYLLMFFVSPFIPVANRRNFKGSVTAFLIILIAQTTLLILCHIILQVVITAFKMDDLFGNCSFTEQLLRHVGFIDLHNLNASAVIEWLVPEVVVFVTALTVYLVIKRLVHIPSNAETDIDSASSRQLQTQRSRSPMDMTTQKKTDVPPHEPHFDTLIRISPFFCMASLFFAAILRPSIPAGIYFVVFLVTGTYWASMRRLGSLFTVILRILVVIIIVHLLCVVAYQTPWMQQHLDKDFLAARLIGLEALVVSSCKNDDIRIMNYDTNTYNISSYFNPLVLCLTFYIMSLSAKNLRKRPPAIEKPTNMLGRQLENGSKKFSRQFSRATKKSQNSKKDNSWTKTQQSLNVSLRREFEQRPMITEPTETTPLVRNSEKKNSFVEAPMQMVEDQPRSSTDIYLESTCDPPTDDKDSKSSVCDQICYGFVSVGGFIYQNSYIFTNILMMAWAIIYHSWLTFVLLLWANLLWMVPKQRTAMLRSSPFVVFYAVLLLLAQYIYGLNLTDEELPSKVNATGINLEQIGFTRPLEPFIPLLTKTSFLLMFWVTLRQFLKEKSIKIRKNTIAGMFAPVSLTVGTVTNNGNNTKKTSLFLKRTGEIIKNLLVRLWIWLLVLVIFLCAITGKSMTIFRICYMALFLFFLLVFQSSSKAWLKIMYGFWLFLIFYVMTLLILIYTYQFDKFDKYWSDYLKIPQISQTDIGLERYETKDLFLHLLSPTIIVILTVIQVHYFHKRFITALQRRRSEDRKISNSQSASFQSLNAGISTEAAGSQKTCWHSTKAFVRKAVRRTKRLLTSFKDIFWRFLELHLIKLVYLTGFITSVNEICILHNLFMILCLVGVCSKKSIQNCISRINSLIISFIILTKMLYQVEYFEHSNYGKNCTLLQETVNNAEWYGLQKASNDKGGLVSILRLDIIYMLMVTLHAVVTLRQYQLRTITGTRSHPISVLLFPKITRADAEKNLRKMIKYLCNYGYYKFGLEITAIWLVADITYRQDIMALLFSAWLVIILWLRRSQIARLWALFGWFIGVGIFVQYFILLGFPPSLCITYSWENSQYSTALQRWAMFSGRKHLDHKSKLIFDFVLLMFIAGQQRVFNIESRQNRQADENIQYPGGSNKNVVADIAKLGQVPFQNPTRDFLSNVRNYLDIFLNIVLSGFYWISLGVVLVGGTNINNFLALGYLIGAFVFLWEGSDFYLRPIQSILQRWTWLIAYNVSNIVIKTALQIGGCFFLEKIRSQCCWLVHVLGISCATRPFVPDLDYEDPNVCAESFTHTFLVWDAICFAFLIFQLRIFKSHYFCHIILDSRANNILSSRGAEILEDLRQKQIRHRQQHEREVLLKIKRKMEKIRATQQKMLRPIDKPTHFDANIIVDTVKMAPLARHSSFSSCQGSGFQTPDEEETDSCTQSHDSKESSSGKEDEEQLLSNAEDLVVQCPQEIRVEYADFASSDAQTDYGDVQSESDAGADHALALRLNAPVHLELPDNVGGGSLSGQQQLTPNSDLLTLPFDGFLEPNRLSVGSAADSDILAMPLQEDMETETESSSVFAPTAYNTLQPPQMHTLMPPTMSAPTSCSLVVNVSGGSSVTSSNLTTSGVARHRRQSSINAVSWNETVSVKRAPQESTGSGEVSEDVPVTLRDKSLHRRHLSVGNATYSMGDTKIIDERRRRSSNVSWARTDNLMRSATRPTSWGPVEHGNPVPVSRPQKRRQPKLHAEAVRAGDYYMFDDMDDKFELDIIEDGKDFLEEQEQLTESEKKMARRKTLFDVWKDITGADYRRHLYTRQRSYASAPGSHFDFYKINDEDFPLGNGDTSESWEGGDAGIRISTHSEPLTLLYSKSEYFEQFKTDKTKGKEPTRTSVEEFEKELIPDAEKKIATDATDVVDQPSETGTKIFEAEKKITKEKKDDIERNPISRLVGGFFVSLVIRLNRFSRNYRYVNKILAAEKRALKESETLRVTRPGADSMFNVFKKTLESSTNEDNVENIAGTSQNDITQLTAITPNETDSPSQLQSPHDSIQEQEQEQDQTQEQQHQEQIEKIEHADHDIMEVPLNTVDSGNKGGSTGSEQKIRFYKMEIMPEIRVNAPSSTRSRLGSITIIKQCSVEVVNSSQYAFDDAEFAARDHHIIVEFMISVWYALLSNTDLICYIVIFVYQICNASITTLPLPLMVFFWGTLSLPRPTKTFWVTLIAYTQAIVLVKCIFQYKLIWSHYEDIHNNPLSWAKILGVEERQNYAIMDLFVLLVLFFHRFILQSHGLWKSKNSYNSEDSKSIKSAEPEVVLKSYNSQEVEEWKDAVSNLELIRDTKSKDTIERRRDEDITDDERKKAGEDKSIKLNTSPEKIINSSDDQLSSVSTVDDKYLTGLRGLQRRKYLSAMQTFFYNLVKKPRLPDDVYALMFLCDFINFFVLLFGFSSFASRQAGKDEDGVKNYLSENKVPIPFLIMILVQFFLIVVDRALYLRKALIPKIVFHFLSVVGVHIWMFFVVPYVTECSFYTLAPPIIFYIFKCFYMLLSSYQIKCGYPRRILGNFLTKGFSIANMISFRVFLIMPFLYELRTVLDWLCTATTMTLFDWLKMEDIFSDIFIIRCTRQLEQDFPVIRAEKKQLFAKLILGGIIILFIVLLIWGPLCIFALGKTVGETNIPYEVTLTVRIGSYDPIYHANNRENILDFDQSMYDKLTNAYKKNREAIAFISNYDSNDIAALKLAANSPSLWTISPPDKERLLSDLRNKKELSARLMYTLTRSEPSTDLPSKVNEEILVTLSKTFEGRQTFIDMIEGKEKNATVTIQGLVPKFLKVPIKKKATTVRTLMPLSETYRPLKLRIHAFSGNVWWEIQDECSDSFYEETLKNLPFSDCESGVVIYTFNEKKFPSTFDFITGVGIIGLYTTSVLVVSRFMKGFITGQSRKIMFEDLPYVDRLLQLCLDIYLVREALEFALEEDLFAKLIFLYRSPETLIKWTRPKEELNEDETDTDSVRSRTSTRRTAERGLEPQS